MEQFWKQLSGPLNSIREQPYQFVVWWIVANIFGLAGFLLPIFLGWVQDKDFGLVFLTAVRSGSLASFSIVLLAEGIAAALVAQGAGSNVVAAGMRGVVSMLALLVAGVQFVFLVAQCLITDGSTPAPLFQVFVTLVAIAFAVYLYCFRFASWEEDVGKLKEAEDQDVQKLAESAQKVTKDDDGVKL